MEKTPQQIHRDEMKLLDYLIGILVLTGGVITIMFLGVVFAVFLER